MAVSGPVRRLRRVLTGWTVPVPAWPAGVAPLAFDSDRHARAAHGLLEEGYAAGGGTVAPFAQWWPALQADSEFDPGLCFLAVDRRGGAAVGFAQCWTSAFVKDIAVARAHRRRGIGRALLLTAFAAFQQRGAAHVDLKVLADNRSGANELYAALGMTEVD